MLIITLDETSDVMANFASLQSWGNRMNARLNDQGTPPFFPFNVRMNKSNIYCFKIHGKESPMIAQEMCLVMPNHKPSELILGTSTLGHSRRADIFHPPFSQ